jgi:hypothetical protein
MKSIALSAPISAQMISDARERAQKLVKITEDCTPRFQTDELTNKMVGIIGEMFFELFLEEHGVPYEKDDFEDRENPKNPDKFDFMIAGKKIDVKTGLFRRGVDIVLHQDSVGLLIPADQFEEKDIDIYVFVAIDQSDLIAHVIGWIRKPLVPLYGYLREDTNVLSWCVPIARLKRMDEFLQYVSLRCMR